MGQMKLAFTLICSFIHSLPMMAPMLLVVDHRRRPCVPLQMSVRRCRRRLSPNGWTLTWDVWPVASATSTRTCATAACWSASWRSSQGNSWSVWKHRNTHTHTHAQAHTARPQRDPHSYTLQGREKSCASLLLSACSTSPLSRAHIQMQWRGFTKHNNATHCGNRTRQEEMTTSHPRGAVLHIYLKRTCSYKNTHVPQGLQLCQTDCTTTLDL